MVYPLALAEERLGEPGGKLRGGASEASGAHGLRYRHTIQAYHTDTIQAYRTDTQYKLTVPTHNTSLPHRHTIQAYRADTQYKLTAPILGSFWDHVETFWDHVWIIFGSFWDHFNQTLLKENKQIEIPRFRA